MAVAAKVPDPPRRRSATRRSSGAPSRGTGTGRPGRRSSKGRGARRRARRRPPARRSRARSPRERGPSIRVPLLARVSTPIARPRNGPRITSPMSARRTGKSVIQKTPPRNAATPRCHTSSRPDQASTASPAARDAHRDEGPTASCGGRSRRSATAPPNAPKRARGSSLSRVMAAVMVAEPVSAKTYTPKTSSLEPPHEARQGADEEDRDESPVGQPAVAAVPEGGQLETPHRCGSIGLGSEYRSGPGTELAPEQHAGHPQGGEHEQGRVEEPRGRGHRVVVGADPRGRNGAPRGRAAGPPAPRNAEFRPPR